MPMRKIAKIVDAAMKDAGRARTHASDPEFRKGVQKDRRAELSKFKTVEHALEDRERLEKGKAKKKS